MLVYHNFVTDLCYLSTLLVLVMASTYSNTKENTVRWNCSHLRLSFLGSSLLFSISVDSYLDHWQSCASSCRGPLGAAGNTDEELHQGRKANTISLIDSGNVLKLINVLSSPLGLLLADGAPTVGRGKTVTPERKVEKSFPRSEINRHAEG